MLSQKLEELYNWLRDHQDFIGKSIDTITDGGLISHLPSLTTSPPSGSAPILPKRFSTGNLPIDTPDLQRLDDGAYRSRQGIAGGLFGRRDLE